MEQWKRVLWSDESRFTIWQSDNDLGLFVGLGPLISVKGNLNAIAYNDILDDSVLPTLWQQFGKGPMLFHHDNAPVHKARSRSVWKNLTGLHRALISTPSNTFGMNWNTDCKPGLIAQHQCLTSRMLMAEWKQVPAAMFQHLVESLPRRVEAVIAAQGRDQLHINAHEFGKRCSSSRCPHILLVM